LDDLNNKYSGEYYSQLLLASIKFEIIISTTNAIAMNHAMKNKMGLTTFMNILLAFVVSISFF